MKVDLLLLFLLTTGIELVASAEEPPTARVQIVNATCVAEISLSVGEKMLYPTFPQGLYTADGESTMLGGRFNIVDLATKRNVVRSITIPAGSDQSLFLLGDFSTDYPADGMPQPGQLPPAPGAKEFEPNFQMLLLSHELAPEEAPIRIRFLNGVPGHILQVTDPAGNSVECAPGDAESLVGQPAEALYKATIKETPVDVYMRQEGPLRNCTVVFFLKNGEPEFTRIFEGSKAYRDALRVETSKEETE